MGSIIGWKRTHVWGLRLVRVWHRARARPPPPPVVSMNAHEYYRYRYPYDQLVALLTRNGEDLSHIEFAIEGTETYTRYVSVKSAKELKAAVLRIPDVEAIHFGAVYHNIPVSQGKRRAGEVNVAHRRVLSFDIDLTDYDWLPLKGADGEISLEKCDAAYHVSATAVRILRCVLEQAFGFTQLLVVYSGRRGVHLHVFDEAAMQLTDEGRAAVVGYLNGDLLKGDLRAHDGVRLVMVMHNLTTEVWSAFEALVAGETDLFQRNAPRVNFVNRLEVEQYQHLAGGALLSLADDVIEPETGVEAWDLIKQKVYSCGARFMAERLDAVVLAYVWPRLDVKVTRQTEHLTKVPFSAHAKSRRVAVAIDADNVDGFDPASAPLLDDFDDEAMAAALRRFVVSEPNTSRPDPDDLGGVCDLEDLARAARSDADTTPVSGNKRSLPRKIGFQRKRSPLAPAPAPAPEAA